MKVRKAKKMLKGLEWAYKIGMGQYSKVRWCKANKCFFCTTRYGQSQRILY